MTENSIELIDLTKKYGSFKAVDCLNLTIRQGEVFGLLGPNGAGKSTTILMVLGLTDPSSGEVRVCGINSTRNPIEVKKLVGYLPEDVGFYDDRTGFENLMYTARLNSIPEAEARRRAETLLMRIGLEEAMHKKCGKYSRGMRQRLGLADVLIKNPKVIILDEPTLGIDPQGVREFLQLIVGLSKEEGITVLFSSHHLHQMQQVCDRVGLFVQGRLLAEGNITSLAHKLFNENSCVIELGVDDLTMNENKLKEVLKDLKTMLSIQQKNRYFEIDCSTDVTSQIARTVVSSGLGLTYLNKKEYGLDDIYNRYFEGGLSHDKR